MVATKQAKPDEQAALEAKAQAATGGPLFSRVCDAIDLDDDRHLTPAELRKALKQPWLAEAISRLVFHHISEWGTPRAQWNAIDGDIPESRKADWEKEKDRIESLQWWSDVNTTPALPGDAKVYAFHPIGIISNFPGLASDCSEEWRVDKKFLEVSEGALALKGYVPKKNGVVIGQSGVTISTGVDLGQQEKNSTTEILNDYVAEFGNVDNVDVTALIDQLNPYFTLKKDYAANKLAEIPLSINLSEANILANSFKFDFRVKIDKRFNKGNSLGMKFKKLPTEAQTVILDFAYQYGLSDSAGSVRTTFWSHTYKGEWQKLADWLVSKPDIYESRRIREGKLLQSGIDKKALPELGDPCPGTG
ncbi:pesticin C-terminus-like muramidase [Xanthomonas cerealis pv. cerealis]|uniref:pesticin C-terminus-like muramidase n=1 Tax=Xanthomonas cerealis TaxID=3390025 RepID=UPI001F402636|nr:pesticin C-terminus-like muramidase [Xanthomonas translucens]UKE69435.1 pesticin C-terminus-like muramidase [Xanthomonas translucens pv. pistacia]